MDDIEISVAQYRLVVEIPGYKLRKGIEVALFEQHSTAEKKYQAIHRLPSASKASNSYIGDLIEGFGATEEAACQDLSQKLSVKFQDLINLKKKNKRLPTPYDHQLQYLRSIMVPE